MRKGGKGEMKMGKGNTLFLRYRNQGLERLKVGVPCISFFTAEFEDIFFASRVDLQGSLECAKAMDTP